MLAAQALLATTPEFKGNIKIPEESSHPVGEAALKPLANSTIPFERRPQAARRRSIGWAAGSATGAPDPGLVV